jgi:hypothetical protein
MVVEIFSGSRRQAVACLTAAREEILLLRG